MNARALYLLVCVLAVVPAANLTAQKKKAGKGAKDAELKLEDLFPDKSLFGPSARGMDFSHDGRYAAYLYRPNLERRHGSDLWVYDTKTKKALRLTDVERMAPFQESTQEVKEDRIKKAKAHAKQEAAKQEAAGKKKADKQKAKQQEDEFDGNTVLESDADDEKAPRYSGVSSFDWSPVADELLFSSGGDVYRIALKDQKIVRWTKTKSSERSVRFLKDGSGFSYMDDDQLMRVHFDHPFVEQLDPKLPSGESMSQYEFSPDGKRLAVVTTKGGDRRSSGRKVNIVSYRNRFAEVREVNRHMADDAWPEMETAVYLYEIPDSQADLAEPHRVFHRKVTGPRDVLSVPEWAPDSSRVVFAVFEQESSKIHLMQAMMPEPKSKEDSDKSDDAKESDKAKESGDSAGQADASQGKNGEKSTDAKKQDPHQAKTILTLLHTGGPNTPRMVDPQYLADSRRVIFLSEQSGYRHLHVLNPLYENVDQLTRGRNEVYPIRLSKDRTLMFVTSTLEHPTTENVYAVDVESGEMTRLSKESGVYSSVAVSPDGKQFVANYVSFGRLTELVTFDMKSSKMTTLTDSHSDQVKELTQPEPELFTYKNRHGHEIFGHVFKPDGWKKSDKRPLLLYVYGGPLGTRKMVTDGSYSADSYFFAYYMAKKHGFVTCTVDPRGVSGYGGLFEKSNFEQVGKPQVEDIVDGVKYMVENCGVDPKKASMHGWSFGGFQTQMCLYTEPDVFACGIAGAGPTEWENYNSWYTTGTIGNSREGKTDLDKFSLLPLAKNLKSRLLLVHGMEDSNVLYQDTVRVYRELLKAGKETLVELFLDPTGGHGLGGDVKRVGRYRKYEEFLLRVLK